MFNFIKSIFSTKQTAFDTLKSVNEQSDNTHSTNEKYKKARALFNEQKHKWENECKMGITTANCPYCGEKLEKFPARKKKCKNCDNYMYVRTRPSDRKKILVKENELKKLEQEWEKTRYYSERERYYKNREKYEDDYSDDEEESSSITIDVSTEAGVAYREATANYKKFLNYDAILNIEEEDRLPLMQYVWSNWGNRSECIYNDLRFVEYPQYSQEDLQCIAFVENARMTNYIKSIHYHKMDFLFMEYKKDWQLQNTMYICQIQDVPYVRQDDLCAGIFKNYLFMPLLTSFGVLSIKENIEKIYYWQNGEEIEMDKETFKNVMKKENVSVVIK